MSRTGKTFRAILKALTLASEGKHVVYECASHNMARWTFEKAVATAQPFIQQDKHSHLKLNIGEGSVRFSRRLLDRELNELNFAPGYELVRDF